MTGPRRPGPRAGLLRRAGRTPTEPRSSPWPEQLTRAGRPETPRHWLIAIAHNVCRQRFRQASRRPEEVPLEAEPAAIVDESDAPTPAEIRRALGHLPFNQRSALVLRELEGRSYAEIAG